MLKTIEISMAVSKEKDEGWVNSVYRDLELRWVCCPPLPSLDRVEVKMVEFFWHLCHPVVSKGGGE